jgi:hypothetical protein
VYRLTKPAKFHVYKLNTAWLNQTNNTDGNTLCVLNNTEQHFQAYVTTVCSMGTTKS